MIDLPRGWPILVKVDARDDGEKWRGTRGEVIGVAVRSVSGTRTIGEGYSGDPARRYAVLFDGENEQVVINEAWLIPQSVAIRLIDEKGKFVYRSTTDKPLEFEEKISSQVAPEIWSVESSGAVEFDRSKGEYVQTVEVKRYI